MAMAICSKVKSDNLIGVSEMNVLHGMLRTRAANNKNSYIFLVGFIQRRRCQRVSLVFFAVVCHLRFAVSSSPEDVDMAGLLDDEEMEQQTRRFPFSARPATAIQQQLQQQPTVSFFVTVLRNVKTGFFFSRSSSASSSRRR